MKKKTHELVDSEFDRLLVKLLHSPQWACRKFLRNQGYPRFIYKYRTLTPDEPGSVSKLADFLVESKLFLASPDTFNDPFDMKATIILEGTPQEKRKRYDEMLKENQPDLLWTKRQQKVTQMMVRPHEKIVEDLRASYAKYRSIMGVCSFAGNPRDIKMWGHYAANQTGVCLQFDIAQELGTRSYKPYPSNYHAEYPIINWVETWSSNLVPLSSESIPNGNTRKSAGSSSQEAQAPITPSSLGRLWARHRM